MNSKSGSNGQSGNMMDTFHDLSDGLTNFVDKNVKDIEQRLSQVASEMDEEKAVNIATGALAALGVGLGATVGKKWFLLSALAGGLYAANKMTEGQLLHPVLGQLGIRDKNSIDGERSQLEGLRNDYSGVGKSQSGNIPGQSLGSGRTSGDSSTGGSNMSGVGSGNISQSASSSSDEPERFHNPLADRSSTQYSRNHQNREEHISSRSGRIASDDNPPSKGKYQ